MNKRQKPKNKISRQIGENVWGHEKCPTNSRNYGPGQHGPTKRKQRRSDYGEQLLEKQKLKKYYGNITEKQFANTFKKASKQRGDTGKNLLILLESRLDAIIYRLGFAPTVFAARQIVNHKHILVNGTYVNIPSYQCSIGDIIAVKEKSQKIPIIIDSIEKNEVPPYLNIDKKKFHGTYIRYPDEDEIPYGVIMNTNAIIEFYSR